MRRATSDGRPPASSPGAVDFGRPVVPLSVVDETLREGLQCVSSANPSLAHKIALLHAMALVGVDVVNVGLPAAGARHAEDARALCQEIQRAKLPLVATAAARTVASDVAEVGRVASRAGAPVEVYAFIGSSPIRHLVEGWDLDFVSRSITSAGQAAASAELPFCLVTEDATRSHPDTLRALFRAAIDAGAQRICLCDTTGHATAHGVLALVEFARRELAALGAGGTGLDWHAHNDRGLGLSTALWAVSAGADRVHGTALGLGERVGNSSVELLVENLGLLGARPLVRREHLVEYCALAARAFGWPIPPDHPIAGERFMRERPHSIVQQPRRAPAVPGARGALQSPPGEAAFRAVPARGFNREIR